MRKIVCREHLTLIDEGFFHKHPFLKTYSRFIHPVEYLFIMCNEPFNKNIPNHPRKFLHAIIECKLIAQITRLDNDHFKHEVILLKDAVNLQLNFFKDLGQIN
jgi:hypothetical protein